MLIDTHCHIHDQCFYPRPQALEMLKRAGERGVGKVICVGTDLADSSEARSFALEVRRENAERQRKSALPDCPKDGFAPLPEVSWTFGVHPDQATGMKAVREIAESCEEKMKEYDCCCRAEQAGREGGDEANETKNAGVGADIGVVADVEAGEVAKSGEAGAELPLSPVGVGEVGLDYHSRGYDRAAQIRLLEEMLQIAVEHGLPVAFHVREAFDDFFPLVANFPQLDGVVHSFSGSKKQLRRILTDTRFYVGVNGMATYSILPVPPLERIVLETDAPFLTPKPFRDIINEPGFVREVAEWLADKLGQDIATVERETSANARRLFKI